MTNITPLIYDPSPGVTPSNGSIIRTDQQNEIADLLNGISSSNYNLVQAIAKKTTTYSLLLTDFAVYCDATSGAFTVTLPDSTVSGISRKMYAIKKSDSTANAVTIATTSSQTIDGSSANVVLIQQGEILLVQSDGSNWQVLAHYLLPFASQQLKMYNPAGTFYYNFVASAIAANYNLTLPLITANDTLVTLGLAQTFTAAKTFTTGLLKIADISDSNGNKSIAITATASAVDYLTVINASTANPATLSIQATGSDSNINLLLSPKGTGRYQISDGTDLTKIVQWNLSGATTAKTSTLSWSFTNARTLTLPDVTDTVAVLGTSQTFSGSMTFSGGITMSSANISLGSNSISTTDLTLNEAQIAFSSTRAITAQITTGTSGTFFAAVPYTSGNQAGFYVLRTPASFITNAEYGYFASDFQVANEFAIGSGNNGTGTARPLNVYMQSSSGGTVTKMMSFDIAKTITHYVSSTFQGTVTIINSAPSITIQNNASQSSPYTVTENFWEGQNNSGTNKIALELDVIMDTLTAGAEMSSMRYYLLLSGIQTEMFHINPAGQNTVQIANTVDFNVGNTPLSTSATKGFLIIPTCAGVPTGTPANSGLGLPMVYDTTDHRLYFYEGGAWHYIARTA